MTLKFDSRRAPLARADFEALVRAVSQAHETDETVWLEWKGQLDLSSAAGKVSVARCVLGFANRLPLVAGRFCEGRAFLVVGAEPGHVRGVEPVDAAVLEPRVNAYLGSEPPRWTPHWVAVDGVRVLVVEVAAPRRGDRVYCLTKDYDRYKNGHVFVRRHGATEQASDSELQALVQRANGAEPALTGLRLTADHTAALRPVDFTDEAIEAWLAQERSACLTSPHAHDAAQRRGSDMTVKRLDEHTAGAEPRTDLNASAFFRDAAALQRSMGAFASGMFETVPEDRSEQEYEAEVEQYLDDCRTELPTVLRSAAAAALEPLSFVLENGTDDNYAQVALEVYCPGDVDAVSPRAREANERGLPARPLPFGPRRKSRYDFGMPTFSPLVLSPGSMASLRPSGEPAVSIERGGSVWLRFGPVDLRPQQRLPLPSTVLLPGPGLSELRVEWSATSTSVKGVARDTLTVPVHGEAWAVGDALAAQR